MKKTTQNDKPQPVKDQPKRKTNTDLPIICVSDSLHFGG